MATAHPIEPLRFEAGALHVLDQRALPNEERWVRCETVEQVADCIRTLAVRGAPAIGVAAAYGMALADDRAAAAELLRATRPTAVNLGWALDRRCLAVGDVLAEARAIHPRPGGERPAHRGPRRRAASGGDRALNHCNAGALATAGYGTGLGVLRAAWERGRLGACGWTRHDRCSRAPA